MNIKLNNYDPLISIKDMSRHQLVLWQQLLLKAAEKDTPGVILCDLGSVRFLSLAQLSSLPEPVQAAINTQAKATAYSTQRLICFIDNDDKVYVFIIQANGIPEALKEISSQLALS